MCVVCAIGKHLNICANITRTALLLNVHFANSFVQRQGIPVVWYDRKGNRISPCLVYLTWSLRMTFMNWIHICGIFSLCSNNVIAVCHLVVKSCFLCQEKCTPCNFLGSLYSVHVYNVGQYYSWTVNLLQMLLCFCWASFINEIQ